MIRGRCLCNKIAFEVEEMPGMIFNCHCSRCRRSHGSAFATQIICKKASLKFLEGRQSLKEYVSENIVRTFCVHCGSRLMNYTNQEPEYLSVSISSVIDRPDFKPVAECFVVDKLPFIQLDSSIAHYSELPKL